MHVNMLQKASPKPAQDWVTDRIWVDVCSLGRLPRFADFSAHFVQHLDHYHRMFEDVEPHKFPLAAEWAGKEDGLQRLILLNIMRPDKVCNCSAPRWLY